MVIEFDLQETTTHLFYLLGATLLSFVIAIALTPAFYKFLIKYRLGKNIRETAATGEKAAIFRELHLKKSGTPTMGGILIWGTTILVIIISRILSYFGYIDHSLLNRNETWLVIFTMITTAILGLVDDYFNIRGIGKAKGLNVKPKFLWQLVLAGLGAWWFYSKLGYNQIHIPGLGDFMIGAWYIPLFMFIFIGSANAVNVTDGLDGLAGGLLIIAYTALGIIAFSKGLLILAAFCGVITGATLAFLWHNIPPAKFYMGDTGSMALGSMMGVIAALTDSIILLALIGIVFVVEMISVIIQITSKKLFKKKVFHIAPLHHHLEYIGWAESKVVMRFWIIGIFCAAAGVIISLLGLF